MLHPERAHRPREHLLKGLLHARLRALANVGLELLHLRRPLRPCRRLPLSRRLFRSRRVRRHLRLQPSSLHACLIRPLCGRDLCRLHLSTQLRCLHRRGAQRLRLRLSRLSRCPSRRRHVRLHCLRRCLQRLHRGHEHRVGFPSGALLAKFDPGGAQDADELRFAAGHVNVVALQLAHARGALRARDEHVDLPLAGRVLPHVGRDDHACADEPQVVLRRSLHVRAEILTQSGPRLAALLVLVRVPGVRVHKDLLGGLQRQLLCVNPPRHARHL